MRKLKTWELGRMSPEEFKEAPKLPLVVVLDNIRSAYNVGAVFRTADAFRVEKLYLCGRTSTPPHGEIYKTALGAEDSMHWEHKPDTLDCVQDLKKQGYIVIGIEQTDGSVPLQTYAADPAQKYALVLGNEVDGVLLEALQACDAVLEIPQEGTKHSLNISVAAGVVLWEFYKKMS
jgi:tRNA G18 (ribose-2'-O)-methylase SpoU